MTINDNSIFDTSTPLKTIEPSRTRVIVYTTNMEEQRPVAFNEGNIGAATVNGDDVSQYYKEVTVNYTSKQTQDAGNEYQLSKGSTTITARNPDGSPAAISDQIGGVVKSFSNEFSSVESQKALSSFKESSNSQFLELNVKKGKGLNAQDPSVIELYNQIKPENQTDPGLLPTTVQQRLTENNLLNPNSKLINGEKSVKEGIKNKIGSLILQTRLGSHAPRKFPSVKSENSTEVTGERLETLSIIDLKNLASKILFSATGGEIKEGMSQTEVDVSAGQQTSLGIKVPFNRFSATEVVKSEKPNFVKPSLNIELSDETRYSYGTVYLPNFTFNSLASSTTLTKTIIFTIMLGIAEGFDFANSLPFGAGAFIPVPSLIRTNSKASDCLIIGFEMFFSSKHDFPTWDANSSDTGFKNAILRRLLAILLEELGLENLTTPEPMSLITSAGNLSKSKFIRIMNLILFSGARAIQIAQSAGIDPKDYKGEFVDTINSTSDLFDTESGAQINPASLIKRSKLSNTASGLLYGSKTAWAMGSTPSSYILPVSIQRAEALLTGNSDNFSTLRGKKYMQVKSVNRFTREEVRVLETTLDASYVPFYFQDLRTNEIISFHAFIKQLEDNFVATYDSSNGYGRVDPIHVYQRTERKIRTQFIVAATNREDFDQMWFKINKFLTLIYPQYTAGRQLNYENNTFYQPFSQIQAASPMIRMRIGDLIKSNYSTFGIGKLFGLAQFNGFRIEDASTSTQTTDTPTSPTEQQILEVRQRMTANTYLPGEKFILNRASGAPSVMSTEAGNFSVNPVIGTDHRITPWYVARSISAETIKVIAPAPSFGTNGYLVETEDKNLPIQGLPDRRLNFQFYIKLSSDETDTPWTTQPIDEEITKAANRLINPIGGGEPPPSNLNTQNFLSITRNPILKSFESTRGEGLAGFIQTIGFDWMMDEANWETNGYGNRAPMMCKITIDFAPMFDISPGLDSNGFMMAPVYPVGNTSNAMLINTNTEDNIITKKGNYDNLIRKSQDPNSPTTTESSATSTRPGSNFGISRIRFFGRDVL